ncbi:MAG: transposase [Alphaproteobacteria bacterium]
MQTIKKNRFTKFDYSTIGAYFITICTQDKKCILSTITSLVGDDARRRRTALGVPKKFNSVGDDALGVPKILLTNIGKVVEQEILKTNKIYKNINIENYVIMPNHIHLIIRVLPNLGTPRVSSPTIGDIIGSFKRFSNKSSNINIWQRSFYDRIIRNDDEYKNINQYILTNPYNWQTDKYFISPVGDDALGVPHPTATNITSVGDDARKRRTALGVPKNNKED